MSIKKNTVWNLLGSFLPLVAAVVFVPYVLHKLGNEAFGVLTLIWALIGYFSLFDFGVGRALTCELGRLRGANALDEIPAAMCSGLFITAITGILGGITMFVLAPWLAKSGLKISAIWQCDAQSAFEFAAIGVVFTTITSGLRGALEGLGRFAASNLTKMYLGICMFTLPALSVYLHGSNLAKITLYLVGARLLMVAWNLFQLKNYLWRSNLGLYFSNIRSLLSFGGWMTVTGIVGPMMVYGDRFFVSAAVGATLLPFYAIPQEGLQRTPNYAGRIMWSIASSPRFIGTKGDGNSIS